MRARLSSSQRCFAATWVRASTCCVAQPPQTPKCGQRGLPRPGDGRSTAVTRARSNLDLDSRCRASTSSPASAPSTNTTLPALRATPRPAASSASISSFIPQLQEFAPVRLVQARQIFFQQSDFFLVGNRRENSPQQLVSQKQKITIFP